MDAAARRAERADRADVDLRGAPRLLAARAGGGRPLLDLPRARAARSRDYVREMGFTHVELLPVMEHPFYGSWGYQATGYFAPTAPLRHAAGLHVPRRHACTRRGIGVILDWVPSHFPTDEHGLGYFDGTHLYEHADPRQGFHPDWESCIFNYGRHEVRSFLLSSARCSGSTRYHVDGLRVDAVASMLYLDYSRKAGRVDPQPVRRPREPRGDRLPAPLQRGGLRELSRTSQTIAEESTAWPMVSRPTYVGGLGFGLKWDMGWMHDTLDYIAQRPGLPQVPPRRAHLPA